VGKENITHSKNLHTRVMIRRIRIQGLFSVCTGFDGYLIVGDERFVLALDKWWGANPSLEFGWVEILNIFCALILVWIKFCMEILSRKGAIK
jgi:hypothetical protein